MNLEEIKGYQDCNPHVVWLIAEVGRLRERLPPTDAPWTLKELDDLKAEREKLIGALGRIKRDIYEPDKITIHIERVLAEVKEQK